MALELPAESGVEEVVQTVRLPAPTAWPVVMAFGITLLFAGLVTTTSVSVLGAILAICGACGWFREVLPHEREEDVPVVPGPPAAVTSHPHVTRFDAEAHELHRRDYRSQFIRYRPESRAAWREALQWPCSR